MRRGREAVIGTTVAAFVAIAVAAGIGLAVRHRMLGPLAHLPQGFSRQARFRSESPGVNQLGRRLVRAFAALGDASVVACTLSRAPGATVVDLKVRSEGDASAVAFSLLVTRSLGMGEAFEVEIRGARALLGSMPARESQRMVSALALALAEMTTTVAWSADGKEWRERPFFSG